MGGSMRSSRTPIHSRHNSNLMRQVLFTLCSILLLGSCKKDNSVTPASAEQSGIYQKSTGSTFQSYNYVMPLNNLVYYNQGNTGCTNATYRANGCLPACCLMGAHLVNNNIAVTPATFTTYCSGMGTNGSGTTIMSAYSYLRNNVFSANLANQATSSTSGISTLSANIRSYLSANRPVVALILYSTSTKTPLTSGNIGHFVLIVGLNETSLGAGTVSYIDPNNNSGTKTANWATFISAMGAAVSSGNCNYMRIGN